MASDDRCARLSLAFFAFLDMTALHREWCYQLSETDDKAVLDAWLSNWSDS